MTSTGWDFNEIQSFYNDFARVYDKDVSLSTYPAPFVLGQWCLDHVHRMKWTECHVLDVGCGTGVSSLPFFKDQQVQYNVTGIDASPVMLEKASQYPFVKTLCADLESDEWCKGVYDLIVCIGVMDFIHQPLQMLKRLRSLLRSTDARVSLSVPQESFPE